MAGLVSEHGVELLTSFWWCNDTKTVAWAVLLLLVRKYGANLLSQIDHAS